MCYAIIGSGMMGRAIAFDIAVFSPNTKITIIDTDAKALQLARKFLSRRGLSYVRCDIENSRHLKKILKGTLVMISAVPYYHNYNLARLAIDIGSHFIDLGGNNDIVKKELGLNRIARQKGLTIIPDCGLAPGLVSSITRDIVDEMDHVDYVKLRVGGLPQKPRPLLNYQIVFSPYGLINEYVEDAVVLDHGRIVKKASMTEIEKTTFPKPFGEMEAFITSGGVSTLPVTYRNTIGYLDYKTIRYPGHCDAFNTIIKLGMADERAVVINGCKVVPRDVLVGVLLRHVPTSGRDVVLLKAFASGIKDGKRLKIEYGLIDYYDAKNNISAMMRATSYPAAIIAQMIAGGAIRARGAFCPEVGVPPKMLFSELRKRGVVIKKMTEKS